MKNCGSSIHSEVATKEFMEFMKQLVTVSMSCVLRKQDFCL